MSDTVDSRLVRLVGEITALHRDAKVTLVIRSPALPAGQVVTWPGMPRAARLSTNRVSSG